MIYTVNDRRSDILAARRGNDDFLSAADKVGTGFFLAGKKAGALHDDINTKLPPWQLGRITLCEHFHTACANHKGIAINTDIFTETTVCGVVLKQMSVGGCITKIIDRNHFKLALLT